MRIMKWILVLAVIALSFGCDKEEKSTTVEVDGEKGSVEVKSEGGEVTVDGEKGSVNVKGQGSEVQINPDGIKVTGDNTDLKIDVDKLAQLKPKTTKGSGDCEAGKSCSYRCPDGGCKYTCPEGASCKSTCSGGGCKVLCRGNCHSTCSGGGCNQACDGGTCAFTCSGGGCKQSNEGAKAFNATCSGEKCS